MNKANLKCNKPVKSWRPEKKKVVKACSRGKEKIIHFGASGYGNNYSPAARKSFRARHKCATAKDKLTARYWACSNLWVKGGDTRKCPAGRVCKYGKSRSKNSRSRKSRSKKSRPRRSRSRRRKSRKSRSRTRKSRSRTRKSRKSRSRKR